MLILFRICASSIKFLKIFHTFKIGSVRVWGRVDGGWGELVTYSEFVS